MAIADLTAQRLRELLDYNPETGLFTWRLRASNRIKVGDVAGTTQRNGYIKIYVDGSNHWAHRLAWLHVTGAHPAHLIDHIDGDPSNNRIANLRDVPQQVNLENQRQILRMSVSGLIGSHFETRSGKFIARVTRNGKVYQLGTFSDPSEAYAARLAALKSDQRFTSSPQA